MFNRFITRYYSSPLPKVFDIQPSLLAGGAAMYGNGAILIAQNAHKRNEADDYWTTLHIEC